MERTTSMGFLPSAFQGTDFNAKNPPNNLHRPSSLSVQADRGTLDILKRLNARHLKKYPNDANLAGRIASYELAGKMQMSVPEIMDLSNETQANIRPLWCRRWFGIARTVCSKLYSSGGWIEKRRTSSAAIQW